ncbi:MAG: reductive dehalogenase [Alphaproteobacteria bacterium]|nr:reductive dehalogenase [Alphaproteobacteria bacterium]
MRLFSHRHRPVHLGALPLERLARASAPMPVAAQLAPIPNDPERRAENLTAACYFMDATLAGIARVPEAAWTGGRLDHAFAIAIVVEDGPVPRDGAPGAAWIGGANAARGDLRAGEIATVIAGYIRRLGFAARAHTATESEIDTGTILVHAGLATVADGRLRVPFLETRYRAAVVTTAMTLAPDRPLGQSTLRAGGLVRRLGLGGTRPSGQDPWRRRRPVHLGPYPMERICRVATTTTLITDDVPRVPKRASFFSRALAGDLGDKAQRERRRFAVKHPFVEAMTPLLQGTVPLQDGPVAASIAPGNADPAANADTVKATSYFLGADMVGICRAPGYAWYSHEEDGTPIAPDHPNAIVMLIDQGFETMEGASGDDWMSGGQSMRGYLRSGEIASVIAAQIRSLGYSARAHTNAYSQVLHIPLVLLAGLGELSRIGELVLNPFVGPRFKSVVVTTDMPLAHDRPIDFGLQDFCNQCLKCARECPCNAISFGDKIMFNGYEMWKPDAEKCTRYRVTNPHGSGCGRCMKMCPFNTEGPLVHCAFLWAAIHLPFTRAWIARLDDWVGNGTRNPVKKWWFDLEVVDKVSVVPKGVNARDLDRDAVMKPEDQKLAVFPADMMPPPDAKAPVPVDRKEGLRRAAAAEKAAAARARLGR